MENKMNEFETTLTFAVNVYDQDIVDIVDIALCDGGIEYWCDETRLECDRIKGLTMPEQLVMDGGAIGLHEEDEGWHTLTKENVISGIKKCVERHFFEMLEDGVFVISEVHVGELAIDAAGIDSVLADCIIQYAIFGELVYG